MLATPNAGKDADTLAHSDTAGENVKHAAALGNSLACSCVAKHGISIRASNYTLRCLSQRNGNMFVENLNTNVRRNLVCTRQRLVSTQASFNGQLVKQMECVLQQSAIFKQQNIYTSNREPATATHSPVACRGTMLSEKGQAEWITVWLYSYNIFEMMEVTEKWTRLVTPGTRDRRWLRGDWKRVVKVTELQRHLQQWGQFYSVVVGTWNFVRDKITRYIHSPHTR